MKNKEMKMNDMTWVTIFSTVGAALAIGIGVLGPAIAMGTGDKPSAGCAGAPAGF
jgi:F0F1-type ATP synthase membrane subunit c/vacuolar-type H+-ATPase subunit K